MIFHENCQLADHSHKISYLIFYLKLGNMSQNLSSAAVVIGALRVNNEDEVSCSRTQHTASYKACPRDLSILSLALYH